MKKILMIIAGFMVMNASIAQFDLGPKVGYITSNLSIDQNDISTSLSNSFLFGAFARIGKKIYLQPEVNYFTSGSVFKTVDINAISPIEQEITLKNICIPLNLGYRLIDLKIFNLRIAGGVAANIIIDKQIESNNTGNYIDPIKLTDINDFTWGYQIGGGVDVLMFTLDVQYYGGLSSLIDNIQVDGTKVLLNSQGNGFMVSIGWKIL